MKSGPVSVCYEFPMLSDKKNTTQLNKSNIFFSYFYKKYAEMEKFQNTGGPRLA